MPTAEQLANDYAQYSDEFLVDNLRRGVLTEVAADAARRELAARGIDADARLAEPQPAAGGDPIARFVSGAAVGTALARAARFPLRAVLGLEPFWLVLLVGVTLDFLYGRIVLRWGIAQLVGMEPVPDYGLPLGYGALVIRALLATGVVVALWRCAGRLQWRLLRVAALCCAVLYASYVLRGTVLLAHGIGDFLAAPPGSTSVMDR